MSGCGCTPQQWVCQMGKELFVSAWCGAEIIASPLFPTYPQEEREVVWALYQEAVGRYLRHCGYAVPLDEEGSAYAGA